MFTEFYHYFKLMTRVFSTLLKSYYVRVIVAIKA